MMMREVPYGAIFSNLLRNRHMSINSLVSSIYLNGKLQVELANFKVSWMWDFCQITKHVLCNILETNH